ncbi:MAG: Scr1 family TA system antitoxin-like transcriptional regulator [Dermatophilaceae bacterium]
MNEEAESRPQPPGRFALERLGQMLREARLGAGMTGPALARATGISQSRISKVETGKYGLADWRDIQRLLDAVGVDSSVNAAILRQYEISQLDPRSFEYINHVGVDKKQLQIQSIEKSSRLLRGYSCAVLPGLLQLGEYAEAVFRSLELKDDEVHRAARARGERQSILADTSKKFMFILGEPLLYYGAESLRTGHLAQSQSDYLIRLSYRRNIAIAVIPNRNGLPIDAGEPFVIYDRRLVAAETVVSEQTSHDVRVVGIYERLFGKLWECAVQGDCAREMIAGAAASLAQEMGVSETHTMGTVGFQDRVRAHQTSASCEELGLLESGKN